MTITLGDQIRIIVNRMKTGELSYDDARAEAAPLLVQLNDAIKQKCKEDGMRFKKVSFEAFAR